MMKTNTTNPFSVQTPEDIGAEEAYSLFVDVFSDFYKIVQPGHTFVHGPRGSGKSMMFRYMMPDCQCLSLQETSKKSSIKDIGYFSIYVPIKLTNLNITELERLEDKHANLLLNEHWMTINCIVLTLASVSEMALAEGNKASLAEVLEFYEGEFKDIFSTVGWDSPFPELNDISDVNVIFKQMNRIAKRMHKHFLKYIRKIALSNKPVIYDGPICGYLDVFVPFIKALKELSFIPNGPVFLLFDDADNLREAQKKVLNTWVSYRTTSFLSIKVSTQMNYDNWYTTAGITIDTPHDFSEINVTEIYTNKGKYKKRLREIVERRLQNHGIDKSPEEFFPPNFAQEERIEEVRKKIAKEYPTKGRGHRVSDDVSRYARPRYMASLKGTSKSGHTYSYSGFDQLVHLSSGIIRFFLEPASYMYSEVNSDNPKKPVEQIPANVQNKIVREQSDKFLHKEFERLGNDDDSSCVSIEKVKCLENLVLSLGRTFSTVLMSDLSERRVFSIAFSRPPDRTIVDVLKLGIRYGYFHESSIGLKDGTGRTKLYVLSRRLAPSFYLDPTSFQGYKFVLPEVIHRAMADPDALVASVKKRGFDSVFQDNQLTLDFDEED